MFGKEVYVARRRKLRAEVQTGVLLFMGNSQSSINFRDNWYPFRQDSTFLYFFGIDIPDLVAIIDIDRDLEMIFGDDISVEDSIWTGTRPRLADLAARVGVEQVLTKSEVMKYLGGSPHQRRVHYLPPFRPDNAQMISEWLSVSMVEVAQRASVDFIKAVVSQRSLKSTEEVVEISKAVDITANMHLAILQHARVDSREYALAGMAHGIAVAAGGQLSFPMILTTNGQILHNHNHGNTLEEGSMLLVDVGAETDMHYAGDLTRTIPVSRRFSQQQGEIYQVVYGAFRAAVANLKPGVLFKDVHLGACRDIAEGLKALGIMQGDLDEAVRRGAHALFFPCGLGHMMGLDVHDMEDLGEQYVGYTNEVNRSTEFGLRSLRLGRVLEKDFVLTVEPGIYFIPELIDLWSAEKRHRDFINYSALSKYRAFGGIRIEDDFLITDSGSRLLGKSLPTSLAEIEDVRSSWS